MGAGKEELKAAVAGVLNTSGYLSDYGWDNAGTLADLVVEGLIAKNWLITSGAVYPLVSAVVTDYTDEGRQWRVYTPWDVEEESSVERD